MTNRNDADRRPRRAAYDYYPTPPEAARALLSVERFDGSIWEPACGAGAISKELIAARHAVISSDLIDRGYGIAPVDFLAEQRPRAKHIITNPPYGRGLANRFIEHALTLTRGTGGSVAMLLNLASLCHPLRHTVWTTTPPAALYALDELICWPNGNPDEAGYRTAQHRYAWVIWRPSAPRTSLIPRPTFWWLWHRRLPRARAVCAAARATAT
jgi:hypothetical protein